MKTLLRYRVKGALPYIFIHDIKINLDYKKAIRLQIFKFATGVNNTSGTGDIFCRRCRWYRWQICRRCSWYRRQFCHRCRWHNQDPDPDRHQDNGDPRKRILLQVFHILGNQNQIFIYAWTLIQETQKTTKTHPEPMEPRYGALKVRVCLNATGSRRF